MNTDAGMLLQYAVIALAVLLSAGYVAKRQLPRVVRAARLACALPLLREGRAPWLQAAGLRIAPEPLSPEAATACATNCGGCGPGPGP